MPSSSQSRGVPDPTVRVAENQLKSSSSILSANINNADSSSNGVNHHRRRDAQSVIHRQTARGICARGIDNGRRRGNLQSQSRREIARRGFDRHIAIRRLDERFAFARYQNHLTDTPL